MTASIVEALALARAFALVLGTSAGGAMPPDLSGYPNPRVVLSQDASSAVLWWDATPWVERLISENAPRDVALKALEVEAVKLFVTRAPSLPIPASRLRIVVVFAKSGMVTGPYRTNASEGVRTLLVAEGSVRPGNDLCPELGGRRETRRLPRRRHRHAVRGPAADAEPRRRCAVACFAAADRCCWPGWR